MVLEYFEVNFPVGDSLGKEAEAIFPPVMILWYVLEIMMAFVPKPFSLKNVKDLLEMILVVDFLNYD